MTPPATIPVDASMEHRTLLRESVADFTARAGDIGRVRGLRGDPREHDRATWRQMAELGWLGILVPEEYGGLGLGLPEAAIIAEGLARVLAPEPYTAAAILAASAIVHADNEALKAERLPQLVDGSLVPILAWQEQAGDCFGAATQTTATPFEGGWRLNGTKRFIAGAAGADAFVVSARTPAGVALFWVLRGEPGVSLELSEIADGRQFGELVLTDASVSRPGMLATEKSAVQALARGIDSAVICSAAELSGVMARSLEMSLDYLRTRVQFGKPIGSFQALQHRAVDLYIQRELASAVLDDALAALDQEPEPPRRAAVVSRAKARCAHAALLITREAIQLHGAIGFTDEYDVGLYLKRALVLAAWLGTAQDHRRRYGRLMAGEPSA